MAGAAVDGVIGSKADPIPEDMTTGKAIYEQRNYIVREQIKKPEEKALKGKGKTETGTVACSITPVWLHVLVGPARSPKRAISPPAG